MRRSTSVGFTDSPFEFTKSNEDTMRQLFAKIKQMTGGVRNRMISRLYVTRYAL